MNVAALGVPAVVPMVEWQSLIIQSGGQNKEDNDAVKKRLTMSGSKTQAAALNGKGRALPSS